MITYLHLLQPLNRLYGRLRHGLTPWRIRGAASLALPWPRQRTLWSETSEPPLERLTRLDADLRLSSATVLRGGNFDSWDFETRVGLLGAARMRAGVEEHGQGKQLLRFRIWPRVPIAATGVVLLAGVFCAVAGYHHSVAGVTIFAALGLAVAVRVLSECSAAVALLLRVPLEQARAEPDDLAASLAGRLPHARVRQEALEAPAYSGVDQEG